MRIVSREAWLAELEVLLVREKAATRELDALAKARQALPWVAVEADYTFQSEIGLVSFDSLFVGRCQLLIYHLCLVQTGPSLVVVAVLGPVR